MRLRKRHTNNQKPISQTKNHKSFFAFFFVASEAIGRCRPTKEQQVVAGRPTRAEEEQQGFRTQEKPGAKPHPETPTTPAMRDRGTHHWSGRAE